MQWQAPFSTLATDRLDMGVNRLLRASRVVVADGVVYWGTGYSEFFMEQQQYGKLYAFELPAAP